MTAVEVALSAPVPGMPADVTRFIGRKSELAEARRLISTHRLVTLTGVGGVGKTRLALRVASKLRRAFPGGTALVDLATVRDPELLVHAVANAVGMVHLPSHEPGPALCGYIGEKHLLLVLDNCEHMLDACGSLCGKLLRKCPKLHILATSREPLGIRGETTWLINPLSLPDPNSAITPRDLGRYEAINLFVDRAKASAPGFEITDDNADTVAALCQRLEGLPLAIELAAVLLRSLSPGQLLDRLSDRFALLARQRGEPQRQRTLWDSIDWSYEQCSDEEKRLWQRLSVFTGGFELDAVETVCGGHGVPTQAVLCRLTSLVDKSIVIAERGCRFRMLEALREFGLTKLRDSGEEQRVREQHQSWYERMLRRAENEWISPWQEYWLARLEAEHANIRSALLYCLTDPRLADSALRMAVFPARFYWWSPWRFSEGRYWLAQAIAHATEDSIPYARAVLHASDLAVVHGDFELARTLFREGCRVAEKLDDPGTTARVEHDRAHIAMWIENNLGEALEHFERALATLRSQPDLHQRVETLLGLMMCGALLADEERVTAYHRETMAITQPMGGLRNKTHSLYALGVCSWLRGDLKRATALQQESLQLKLGFHDLQGIAFSLEALACIAVEEEHPQRAATLMGAAQTFRQTIGTSIEGLPVLYQRYEESVRRCRAALSRRQFDTANERGLAFTAEEAVAYALGESPRPAPPPDRTSLTRREREVAELLTHGLSNRQIAEALVISPRTAECHVENILVKLGLTSRDQVVARISDRI